MDLEQHGHIGMLVHGAAVVSQTGAVGGAHLHQPGSGLLHHIGDTEPAADLHQFSPADRHTGSLGQGGQHQQHGGGTVVDHKRRFGATQSRQQGSGVNATRPSLPRFQVNFQR